MRSKRNKGRKKIESVPWAFARKYIPYYYGFFWFILIMYLILK